MVFSQSMSVHLKDLSPFTWYVIAIKSHTESTAGPYSKPVIVQTKEGSKACIIILSMWF